MVISVMTGRSQSITMSHNEQAPPDQTSQATVHLTPLRPITVWTSRRAGHDDCVDAGGMKVDLVKEMID